MTGENGRQYWGSSCTLLLELLIQSTKREAQSIIQEEETRNKLSVARVCSSEKEVHSRKDRRWRRRFHNSSRASICAFDRSLTGDCCFCCTCICTNIKPPPLIPSLTHSLGLHSIPILFMSIAVRFCSDDLYEFQNEIARHTWFIVHSFDYFKETIDGKLAFSDVWLFYGPVRIRNREREGEKALI